ncbi:hypothetical protein J6590_088828 [Homalodisca vitripennis]|nr:hypothetical protein J6590_088828 [Homalodisca vitripennis]
MEGQNRARIFLRRIPYKYLQGFPALPKRRLIYFRPSRSLFNKVQIIEEIGNYVAPRGAGGKASKKMAGIEIAHKYERVGQLVQEILSWKNFWRRGNVNTTDVFTHPACKRVFNGTSTIQRRICENPKFSTGMSVIRVVMAEDIPPPKMGIPGETGCPEYIEYLVLFDARRGRSSQRIGYVLRGLPQTSPILLTSITERQFLTCNYFENFLFFQICFKAARALRILALAVDAMYITISTVLVTVDIFSTDYRCQGYYKFCLNIRTVYIYSPSEDF